VGEWRELEPARRAAFEVAWEAFAAQIAAPLVPLPWRR
jgi:hypothetical protein